jgi:hypothetical protein
MPSAPVAIIAGPSMADVELAGGGGTLGDRELQAFAATPSTPTPTTCVQRIILISRIVFECSDKRQR